jgi:hypothetical protein
VPKGIPRRVTRRAKARVPRVVIRVELDARVAGELVRFARAQRMAPSELFQEAAVLWWLRELHRIERRRRLSVKKYLEETDDWTPLDDLLGRSCDT